MKSRLGSIAGRVTVQGKPVSGLSVSLQPRRKDFFIDDAIATSTSDAEGRYHFANVHSGHYWIEILAREYVSVNGYYDDGPGRDVSLGDGCGLVDGDIELIRGGVVSGRIVDSEGAAVPGEPVFLIQEQERGRQEYMFFDGNDGEPFETDDNGYYRAYGIPPGRYLVGVGEDIARVTGEVRERGEFSGNGSVEADHYYAETFHPGVTDNRGAHVLQVTAGSDLTGVDITVGTRFRAFTVSGRVIDDETGEPVRNCYIELGYKTRGGHRSSYSGNGPSDTDSEGRFSKTGLLPGRFYVNAQFEGSTGVYCSPVEFEIKEHDVVGLEIKAQSGVSLRGTVFVEGVRMADFSSTLSRLKLQVSEPVRGEASPLQREAAVAENGTFEITGLRPGDFEFSIGRCDVGQYFSLLRVEGGGDSNSAALTGIPGRERPTLTVGKSGLTGVRVVLAYKSGRIKIHVDIENGKLPVGIRLIAWIVRDYGNGSWSTLPELDANREFTQEGLEPGEYQIEIGDGMRRFTEKKIVRVTSGEARVSFVVDASKIKPRE